MTTLLQELDEVLAKQSKSSVFDAFAFANLLRDNAPQIRAALELQAKLNEGWVLVPREPSVAMRGVLYKTRSGFGDDYMTPEQADAIWSDLVNAAPPAGKEEQDDAR